MTSQHQISPACITQTTTATNSKPSIDHTSTCGTSGCVVKRAISPSVKVGSMKSTECLSPCAVVKQMHCHTLTERNIVRLLRSSIGETLPCYLALAVLVIATHFSFNAISNSFSVWNVWWYGWITALSTGLGAAPFLVARQFDKFWLGVSNGFAAGMMLAATFCLLCEGLSVPHSADDDVPVTIRTLIGAVCGVIFLVFSKGILDQYEDLKVGSLGGLDARKALLIVGVMTLHSFSEGVGIGVSFGGDGGHQRGQLISAALAIHNIPEGLAVCLVLIPRGLSVPYAALWSIFSSLPQPLMAAPAFLFVEEFLPFLPCGLGFAAGAMGYVACFDLLVESLEDTNSKLITCGSAIVSGICMLGVQYYLHD